MVPFRAAACVACLSLATAAGAQTTVRASAPLPVPAAAIAKALNLPLADRSRLMLDAIRLSFNAPEGLDDDSARWRGRLAVALQGAPAAAGETVPLPLGSAIWRETLLDKPVPDAAVTGAILTNRVAALLYYGFSALDDETLAWFASDRNALRQLKAHPGAFAVFGRSIRVHGGRIVAPGGPAAEAAWQEVVGEPLSNPRRFIQSLLSRDRGRFAFLYDSIAHLDAPRQRFALGGEAASAHRLRALAAVFEEFGRDWDVEPRPFARPQLDPFMSMLAVDVAEDGSARAPGTAVLEHVFRGDSGVDVPFREPSSAKIHATGEPLDAAWLAQRINLVPYPIGRRRLDVFLYGQRAIDAGRLEPRVVATLLRAVMSMPSLMLTLERAGIRDATVLMAAVRHAQALNAVGDDDARRDAIALFQVSLSFIERGVRAMTLGADAARALVSALAAVPVDRGRGYDERIAAWLRGALFAASPQPALDDAAPVETAILALTAGTRPGRPQPIVEWEGRQYRADPAAGELLRLRRVRERQGAPPIDEAIAALFAKRRAGERRQAARRDFVGAVVSLHYAGYLGDPEGPALAADDVARRHELESAVARAGIQTMAAWRLPSETFGPSGWRVQGSLLGLDVGLRRLALRRLDDSRLPSGSALPVLERQIATLPVALMNPHALGDAERDGIAAALRRGRERFAAARADPSLLDAFAREAGIGEWRREQVRWALANEPDAVDRLISPREMFYAGVDGSARLREFDAWGGAMLPLTGCLCLRMPPPVAWESLTGRPAAGILGTLAIDLSLRVADTLAELRLPASLAPGILAFALLDAIDAANPAYFDEWQAFPRAVQQIPTGRLLDYIAALTAMGPLVPVAGGT